MKNYWLLLISLCIGFFLHSCSEDEINFSPLSYDLKFSKDSVFCDTLYHNVRSETYFVKVYNPENKDITIPNIRLKSGENSLYRINVDGKSGFSFNNVPLRKKDSLYIFIEVAAKANSKEFIAEDEILFSNHSQQKITLFSVIQDAEFFIQSPNNPNIITENTTWTDDKVKVIFGNLTLAEGKKLNIKAGTKIYFFKNSALHLAKNTELNVEGEMDKEVIFRGERHSTRYDTIPLNWKGITIDENSKINLNYTKILGSDTGIKMKNSEMNVKNSIFHTFQNYGILAIQSKIKGQNLVMNNAGQASLALMGGGELNLTHATIVNFWRENLITPAHALWAENLWKEENQEISSPVHILIKNSIIYNPKNTGIFFSPKEGMDFNYEIHHSLLSLNENSGFDFENNPKIFISIRNKNPEFLFPFVSKMNLRLKENSPAQKTANPTFTNEITSDIKGIDRTHLPNMGAYQ